MNFTWLKNKKVVVTGNTGFKGSWLSLILLKYGAKVYGISKSVPTSPSLFELTGMSNEVEQIVADMCDPATMQKLEAIQPDIIFHLAAQPLFIEGIRQPRFTIENNLSATLTVLEYLRKTTTTCTALIITSDKSYFNQEWPWSYRETDLLGGKEPYGTSKALCEIVYATYYRTYYKYMSNIRSATLRSGNVIGGGDFSEKRIIPDCINSWQAGKPVTLRSPDAIRPWQHVLEPLNGYLQVCHSLMENEKANGEAFNFGPSDRSYHKVLDVVKELSSNLNIELPGPVYIEEREANNQEATTLKICSDKSESFFGWKPRLAFHESVKLTSDWYSTLLKNPSQIRSVTDAQIDAYFSNL